MRAAFIKEGGLLFHRNTEILQTAEAFISWLLCLAHSFIPIFLVIYLVYYKEIKIKGGKISLFLPVLNIGTVFLFCFPIFPRNTLRE